MASGAIGLLIHLFASCMRLSAYNYMLIRKLALRSTGVLLSVRLVWGR